MGNCYKYIVLIIAVAFLFSDVRITKANRIKTPSGNATAFVSPFLKKAVEVDLKTCSGDESIHLSLCWGVIKIEREYFPGVDKSFAEDERADDYTKAKAKVTTTYGQDYVDRYSNEDNIFPAKHEQLFNAVDSDTGPIENLLNFTGYNGSDTATKASRPDQPELEYTYSSDYKTTFTLSVVSDSKTQPYDVTVRIIRTPWKLKKDWSLVLDTLWFARGMILNKPVSCDEKPGSGYEVKEGVSPTGSPTCVMTFKNVLTTKLLPKDPNELESLGFVNLAAENKNRYYTTIDIPVSSSYYQAVDVRDITPSNSGFPSPSPTTINNR